MLPACQLTCMHTCEISDAKRHPFLSLSPSASSSLSLPPCFICCFFWLGKKVRDVEGIQKRMYTCGTSWECFSFLIKVTSALQYGRIPDLQIGVRLTGWKPRLLISRLRCAWLYARAGLLVGQRTMCLLLTCGSSCLLCP